MRAHLLRLSVGSLLVGGLVSTASAQLVIPAGAEMNLGGGTIDLGCTPLQIAGIYDLGGGSMLDAGALQIQSSGVFNAQGTAEFGSTFNNEGTLNTQGSTVTLDGECAAPGSTIAIAGASTFTNLVISSSSGQTFELQPGASILVTGNLTVQGTAGQPVRLTSASGEPVNIRLGPDAHVTQTNAVLVNVTVGNPQPPASTKPVPVANGAVAWGLSLLMFFLSCGALRSRRNRSIFRSFF